VSREVTVPDASGTFGLGRLESRFSGATAWAGVMRFSVIASELTIAMGTVARSARVERRRWRAPIWRGPPVGAGPDAA
jgi:hypothetical protein